MKDFGVDVTAKRVKAVGINTDGSIFPVNPIQGFDFNLWEGGADMLDWIDPNSPTVGSLFNLIDRLQELGATFRIVEVETTIIPTPPEPPTPPPPTIPNVLFDLVFTDNSILDFVLTSTDFDRFIQLQEFPNVVIRNIRDTTANSVPLARVQELIRAHILTLPDDKVNVGMVTIEPFNFRIIDEENNRITGQIRYDATELFNPFFFNKKLIGYTQIKNFSTKEVITIKPNDLNFSSTERDELIQINENIGKVGKLEIDFFVQQLNDQRDFANIKTIVVTIGAPPPPPPVEPTEGGIMKKIVGGLMAVSTLSLLRSR